MHSTPQGPIVDFLFETPSLLLLLPLLLRLIPWRREQERWRAGPELALLLLCGALVVAITSGWLIGFHQLGGPLTGSDFTEYCQATGALRDDRLHLFSHNRSKLAAWPAAYFARSLGVIDGHAVAALIFTGVVGAGVYTWGRAVHGRLAGVCAAVAYGAVGPLVLLPRTLSYYPQTISAFVWSAAGAAVALRWRTWPALLLGGVGTSLALLADVRGLFWALPALGLSLLAACVPVKWRVPKSWLWLPLRIALVLGPVALSYQAGGYAFSERSWNLEHQAAGLIQDRRIELGMSVHPQAFPTAYLWGHSDPRQIPRTLRTLVQIREGMPEQVATMPRTLHDRALHVEPWLPVTGGALLIGALGLLRRPWQLIALLGTLVPFAVVLRSAVEILIHPRFIQTPMAGFPVVLGVAFAVLAAGAPSLEAHSAGRLRWKTWARPAATAGLALALVLGGVPSWLSPAAHWRAPFGVTESIGRMIRTVAAKERLSNRGDTGCYQVLWRDFHEAGHPAGSRLYGLYYQ